MWAGSSAVNRSVCKGGPRPGEGAEAADAAATAAQEVAVGTLKPSSKLSFPWLTVLQQVACALLQLKECQQHTAPLLQEKLVDTFHRGGSDCCMADPCCSGKEYFRELQRRQSN